MNMSLTKILVVLLMLGIHSGLVYSFLSTTTTTYCQDIGLSISVIGFLSIKTIPYSLKCLWSPLIDNYNIKLFSSNYDIKKFWMLCMQFLLCVFIGAFGYIITSDNLYFLTIYLIAIGFFGATYDIAMEAYRIELLTQINIVGIGNIIIIYGFRIGYAISTIFCLYLSTIIEWRYVCIILSLFILLSMVSTYFAPHNNKTKLSEEHINCKKYSIYDFIVPIQSLANIPNFKLIIMIISFYKISDIYLDNLSIPFLMHIGFSKNAIAGVAKLSSALGTIIGTCVGSIYISKNKFKYSLFFAGILSSVTNLQFLLFIKMKKSLAVLAIIHFIESISYGISNITFISYASSLCHKKYIATHYSILISLSSLTRLLLSPTSGIIVKNFGWQNFFIVSSLFFIPSLLCIILLYWNTES